MKSWNVKELLVPSGDKTIGKGFTFLKEKQIAVCFWLMCWRENGIEK